MYCVTVGWIGDGWTDEEETVVRKFQFLVISTGDSTRCFSV